MSGPYEGQPPPWRDERPPSPVRQRLAEPRPTGLARSTRVWSESIRKLSLAIESALPERFRGGGH